MKTKRSGTKKTTATSARREPSRSSGKVSGRGAAGASKSASRPGGKVGAAKATAKAGAAKPRGKVGAAEARGKVGKGTGKSTKPAVKAGLLPPALEKAAKPTRSPAKQKQLQQARVAAETAIEAALAKKALVPVVIDVSSQTTYTDFIGIVSGRSDRQVEAIAESIVAALKEIDFRLVGREGSGNGRWTLLDFGDVVMHVFYHPVREFYDIESLWIDAPRLKLKVPAEAMAVAEGALYYDQP